MAEPITTVGLGAIAAYLGKDGLAKILGPTADYLGGELQEFTKKRIDNIGKIFTRSSRHFRYFIEKLFKIRFSHFFILIQVSINLLEAVQTLKPIIKTNLLQDLFVDIFIRTKTNIGTKK